jgi:hypothetical protein
MYGPLGQHRCRSVTEQFSERNLSQIHCLHRTLNPLAAYCWVEWEEMGDFGNSEKEKKVSGAVKEAYLVYR